MSQNIVCFADVEEVVTLILSRACVLTLAKHLQMCNVYISSSGSAHKKLSQNIVCLVDVEEAVTLLISRACISALCYKSTDTQCLRFI